MLQTPEKHRVTCLQLSYLSKLLGPSRNKSARILLTLVVKQCCDNLQGNVDVLSVEFR